jgi:hypothetical protein
MAPVRASRVLPPTALARCCHLGEGFLPQECKIDMPRHVWLKWKRAASGGATFTACVLACHISQKLGYDSYPCIVLRSSVHHLQLRICDPLLRKGHERLWCRATARLGISPGPRQPRRRAASSSVADLHDTLGYQSPSARKATPSERPADSLVYDLHLRPMRARYLPQPSRFTPPWEEHAAAVTWLLRSFDYRRRSASRSRSCRVSS